MNQAPETPNVSQAELDKFSRLAHCWWDLHGECKPLHDINPLRMGFITDQAKNIHEHTIVDVGCGGGILSEALASTGATITGIDLNADLIHVAKEHAKHNQLNIDYQHISLTEFANTHSQCFDTVVCMELIEHVPDPSTLIAELNQCLKPGGLLFMATINRNLKAYAQAIIAAEYLLRLLPPGTHDYQKFIKPSEMTAWCVEHGLELQALQGMSYNPLSKTYSLTSDVSVNYLACFQKN